MPYITINQLNVFYYDNKQKGIPLLFIHGWLGSSIEWCYQIFHFNSKNHILLLDLPGFGKSEKLIKEYSIDFFTDLILEFLNLLDYKKVILIGHSLGGLISQNISIKSPEIVEKLILISSITAISGSLIERLILYWVNLIFKFRYKSFLKDTIKKISSMNAENHEFRKLYRSSLGLPKSVVLNTFKNMTLKFSLKKDLVQIIHPSLIIYGTEDSIISFSMINDLSKLIPNSEVISIYNSSHRLQYNSPEIINKLIEEFINK